MDCSEQELTVQFEKFHDTFKAGNFALFGMFAELHDEMTRIFNIYHAADPKNIIKNEVNRAFTQHIDNLYVRPRRRDRGHDAVPGLRRAERRPLRRPGVATSGATFFRSIGGSIGPRPRRDLRRPTVRRPGPLPRRTLSRPASTHPPEPAPPSWPSCRPGPLPLHPRLRRVPARRVRHRHAHRRGRVAVTWLLKEVPLRQAASAPDPAQVLVPNAVPEVGTPPTRSSGPCPCSPASETGPAL